MVALLKHRLPKSRVVLGVLAFLVLVGGMGLLRAVRGPADAGEGYAIYEVARKDFVVSVEENGSLEPVRETTIRNEVAGTSRIVYLVPEGTFVEEGDLLVELDASSLEERLERRQLAYESRLSNHAAAESRLVIVTSDVESEIRKAQLAVDFARMDMEKFEKVEKAHLLREAELDRLLADASLQLSKERFRNSQTLAAAGFETTSVLNRDRLAVTSGSARLENASNRETAARKFDVIKRYQKLAADLVESQKALMRTKREGENRVTQAVAKESSAKVALDLAKEALTEAEDQLDATKLHAPHAGMVVYGGSGSRSSRESMIEEGAMIRQRQEIITIPDTSAMKIVIKVHETEVNELEIGQDAVVSLDTAPDRRLAGQVSKVAIFPERNRRRSSGDARVYKTEITLRDQVGEDVPPGASGKAQVIVHYVQDAIAIPLEAVSTVEGQSLVEVQGANGESAMREVTLGAFTDQYIHILEGLAEGERVVMRDNDMNAS